MQFVERTLQFFHEIGNNFIYQEIAASAAINLPSEISGISSAFFVALAFFISILSTTAAFLTKYKKAYLYAKYAWSMTVVIMLEDRIIARELQQHQYIFNLIFLLSHYCAGITIVEFFTEFCKEALSSKSRYLYRSAMVICWLGIICAFGAQDIGFSLIILQGITVGFYISTLAMRILESADLSYRIYLASMANLVIFVVLYCFRIAGLPLIPILAGLELQIGGSIEMAGGLLAVAIQYRKYLNSVAEEQKDLRERMHQYERLSALGLMAGGIAHEINNPLSVIKAIASNLRFEIERKIEPTKTLDFLRDIDQMIARIADIIQSLVILGRDEGRISTAKCNLKKSIQLALEGEPICQDLLKIALHNGECDNEIIFCDEIVLVQTVSNIIQNALYEIKMEEHPWIRISYRKRQQNVEIVIQNSGLKISEEVAKKAFNPFYTTKEVGQGMGLGLALSKKMMNLHQGDLAIDLKESHTTFVIALLSA